MLRAGVRVYTRRLWQWIEVFPQRIQAARSFELLLVPRYALRSVSKRNVMRSWWRYQEFNHAVVIEIAVFLHRLAVTGEMGDGTATGKGHVMRSSFSPEAGPIWGSGPQSRRTYCAQCGKSLEAGHRPRRLRISRRAEGSIRCFHGSPAAL